MIHRLVLVIAVLLSTSPLLRACDICGCSVQSGFVGIFPQFHNSMIGYRNMYRSSSHPQTIYNMNGESIVKEDRFFRQEIWLRYFINEKLQVFGYVPYQMNRRIESLRTTNIQGIGDIQASLNYTLWNTAGKNGDGWENTLIAGLGIRLPTGKYQQRDETRVILPIGMQAGNGAYGFLAQANHIIKIRKYGLHSSAQYWVNQKNELDFKPGNQLLTTVSAFYWYQKGSFVLLPHGGLAFEKTNPDKEYNALKSHSGADSFYTNIGVDIYFNRFMFQLTGQLPIIHNQSAAQPKDQFRLSMGLALFF